MVLNYVCTARRGSSCLTVAHLLNRTSLHQFAALLQVLLNSRVEHDNSPVPGQSLASGDATHSEAGRSVSEMESCSVARSQADALFQFNRAASLSRASGSSLTSMSRSSSLQTPEEVAARRVRTAGSGITRQQPYRAVLRPAIRHISLLTAIRRRELPLLMSAATLIYTAGEATAGAAASR